MNKTRCKWCNTNNLKYVEYHDKEWGQSKHDDQKILELLILEMFQAGLSWEIILNKRDSFSKAFDHYDILKIINYKENKISKLLNNKNIIRNKRKIEAAINNAKIFLSIQKEWNSFANYIWHFTNNQVIYEIDKSKSHLSDLISKELKNKGMKFVGSTIVYSFLQAIGIIYSHEKKCFMYKNQKYK
ncbi:DNA-3-methyladenine glycosylase I [Mesomycoplasma moatsii]|uniref:DNA-3-methyladenine glycosylase I n=1 Tax=Mesomycoplasma moatsii TaxID=171287 RepID=UPI0003B3B216